MSFLIASLFCFTSVILMYVSCACGKIVGRSSQANYLKRNSAMDDSIGGS